jgi:hypothetical protein
VINVFGENVLDPEAFQFKTFVVRSTYLVGIAASSVISVRSSVRIELVRLASWPRQISRDPHDAVSEVIFESTELVEAPRVLLVWEEPSEGRVNLAWRGDGAVVWTSEPEGTYGSLVLPGLERSSFQASDASVDAGEVAMLTESGFRYRQCPPLNESLRERFNIKAVSPGRSPAS